MGDTSQELATPGTAVMHIDRRSTSQIVIGIDGGPAAAAALRWAAHWSRVTGLDVQVVHAWQLEDRRTGPAGAVLRQAAGADARARATQWVIDALAVSDPSLHWTLGIVEEAPGPALVALSRTALLLVVGTGDHAGLHGLVLGSVSQYAIARAAPPVVVIKASPAAPKRT